MSCLNLAWSVKVSTGSKAAYLGHLLMPLLFKKQWRQPWLTWGEPGIPSPIIDAGYQTKVLVFFLKTTSYYTH
jgi:hypothetical protein